MSSHQFSVVDSSVQRDVDFSTKDGFRARVRTLVTTHHQGGPFSITAFVESDPSFGQSVGGSRIVGDGTLEDATVEVVKLAAGMASKNPGAGIPASGQKTVTVWPDAPSDPAERAALLAAHYRVVLASEPGAIFGPDMNVGEDVQDVLAASPDLLDHVTGLSHEAGGLSIDSTGYTGRALVGALRGWEGVATCARVTIQGFGAVGAWAARALAEQHPHLRLVAISNRYGTAVSQGDEGLPVDTLFNIWASSDDPDAAIRDAAEQDPAIDWHPDPEHLWAVPCDIFIPAARTGVIRLSGEESERDDAVPVEAWHARSGVRAILQGANAPCTLGAEAYLAAQGVVVFPDFIVNSGGVWGCWAEWYAREALRSGAIAHEALDHTVHQIIADKIAGNIQRVLGRPDPRQAAAEVKQANVQPVAALWKALAEREPDAHARARVHAEQLRL